jgi:hypothetical protein
VAIAFSELTTGTDATDRTTYTTASVTLTAGRLYLLSVCFNPNSVTVSATTTGAAITFDQVTNVGNAVGHNVKIMRALPTSTVTDTIDINVATGTGCIWHLIEVTGMDASGSNGAGAIVQTATVALGTAATSVTKSFTTVASVVAGDARFTAAGVALNSAVTVTSNDADANGVWDAMGTSRGHASPNTAARVAWDSDPDTTDITATWTHSSARSTLAMVELKASSGDTEFVGSIPI